MSEPTHKFNTIPSDILMGVNQTVECVVANSKNLDGSVENMRTSLEQNCIQATEKFTESAHQLSTVRDDRQRESAERNHARDALRLAIARSFLGIFEIVHTVAHGSEPNA